VNIRSLRFKLSWIHGLVIAVVITTIGLIRYQMISYRSQRAFEEHLLLDARFFVSHMTISPQGFGWTTQDLNSSDSLSVLELTEYFVLTDANGLVFRKDLHSKYMQQMLADGVLAGLLKEHSGFSNTVAADGTIYRFVSLPLPSPADQRPFFVHIGRAFDPLAGALNEYLFIYLWSAPMLLAVSIPVAWYLAGRALKPFEEVARTAEQITSKNLNTRIVTTHQEQEVLRLVDAFNAMVGRLQDSFQRMRKFNADAAHELRTPLAILQGENEIALRSSAVPEDIRSVLVSNLEELDRLTRIVNDMLTLAEADAGSQVLAMKPLNLKPLLEDLVDQMRLLAMDRSIHIDLCGLKDATVDADELWIRRALLNLLDNAIKYSKNEGTVEVRVQTNGSIVTLAVRDDGIGISAEDLPHIFDRLYRADPARSRASGGAGLGLALVKWIVEEHKGHINVQSQPDLGATFELVFPLSSLQPAALSNGPGALSVPH